MKIENCDIFEKMYKNIRNMDSELKAAGKDPEFIDDIIYSRLTTTCIGSKYLPLKNISELRAKEK